VGRVFQILACLAVCILVVSGVSASSYAAYVKTGTGVIVNGNRISFERSPVIDSGRILVPGRTVCTKMGATLEWYEKQGKIRVIKGSNAFEMYIGSPTVRMDGTVKRMDTVPYLQNGTVMLPLRFAAENLGYKVSLDTRNNNVIIASSVQKPGGSTGNDKKAFKVVIDAGHGGYQTGAAVSGVYEKNLNLDIAKRLNSLLQAEGVKTYMTRTGDSYVSLYQRSGLANSVDADLLVSIHNNAQKQNWVTGSMTLYYPYGGNSRGSLSAEKFASIVQDNITGGIGTKDLGIIKRPNLAVLRTAKMPAVIVEVGYMTNKTDFKNLLSASFKQKAANSLKDAVIQALDRI